MNFSCIQLPCNGGLPCDGSSSITWQQLLPIHGRTKLPRPATHTMKLQKVVLPDISTLYPIISIQVKEQVSRHAQINSTKPNRKKYVFLPCNRRNTSIFSKQKCWEIFCQAQPQLQPQLQLWLRLVLFLDSSSHPPPPLSEKV